MDTGRTLATLAVTLLICLVFLLSRNPRRMGWLGPRAVVSFAGGAAVAYIFMDLSPSLQQVAGDFRAATRHLALPGRGYGIHLATMSGFLFFYGLEELVIRSCGEEERRRRRERNQPHRLFRIHMAAFTSYAWLVSYLLVRSSEQSGSAMVFYAVAMAFHFLSVAHALREEHGALYSRVGAGLLAAGSLAGWLSGVIVELPHPVVGVLFGLVAGGVIANTVISELPREKQGRFGPFLVGAALYTAVLLLAG